MKKKIRACASSITIIENVIRYTSSRQAHHNMNIMSTSISAWRIFLLLVQFFLFFTTTDAFISAKRSIAGHGKLEMPTRSTTLQPPHKTYSSNSRTYCSTLTKSSASSSPTQLHMVWKTKDPKGVAMDFPKTEARFVAMILATLFTWHGIVVHSMNPVLA